MALQNSRKNGNGSGMGKGSAVPDVVARKFNWGAFFSYFHMGYWKQVIYNSVDFIGSGYSNSSFGNVYLVWNNGQSLGMAEQRIFKC